MSNLLVVLNNKNIILPDIISQLLNGCKSYTVFNTSEELAVAATNGKENAQYEVQYDVPGKGNYVEAIVQRVKNGIIGLFHILPPALAWLWRLVAPRGHNNPSIVSSGGMESEGVGSYWPFATGKRIPQANMMLKQIIDTPRTTFTLVPNQNIGVWQVGFKPQLLMREYLTRRGAARLRTDQYQAARCPLLGYELNYLTLEGSKIPSRFLKVYNQTEVGFEGYDAGAEILRAFFKKELQQYLKDDLLQTGKRVIDACLSNATIEEYNEIIPMSYQYEYSFNKIEDYEQSGDNNGF